MIDLQLGCLSLQLGCLSYNMTFNFPIKMLIGQGQQQMSDTVIPEMTSDNGVYNVSFADVDRFHSE